MIYTLFASDVPGLPNIIREKLTAWMKYQGINPDTCAAIAYNYENKETWVRRYKTFGGAAVWDDDYNPVYEEEFVPLAGDSHPDFLEYMMPSEQPPAWLGQPMRVLISGDIRPRDPEPNK